MSIYSVLLMVIMNLDISNSEFKTIVHVAAMNENRYQFSRRSIYTSEKDANSKNDKTVDDKYRLEKGFLGAHSDIGGGYADGDLSNVALMWMIKQAQEKGGVKFGDYSKYNQINNPIVHDNVWQPMIVFTMAGQFKWASDSTKGLDKSSIFNNYDHLSLNWNDTKAFQNPNHKQFDKVETLTNKYLKDPIANHAIYPGMVLDPMVYDRHEEYGDLKGGDLKGAGDVLISDSDKNKAIALYDYLKWLKCNYQLDIDTKRKEKDFVSNLTEKQLCSGKPLQSYLPIETKKQGFNGWLLLLVLIGLGGCQASGVNKSPCI